MLRPSRLGVFEGETVKGITRIYEGLWQGCQRDFFKDSCTFVYMGVSIQAQETERGSVNLRCLLPGLLTHVSFFITRGCTYIDDDDDDDDDDRDEGGLNGPLMRRFGAGSDAIWMGAHQAISAPGHQHSVMADESVWANFQWSQRVSSGRNPLEPGQLMPADNRPVQPIARCQ